MLTKLIELGHKMKGQMKATQSEIKQNVQGTNTDRKEIGTQNNEERLRNLRNNFKLSNIRIIGVSEGEQEEQEIENLFEQK